MQAQVSIFSVRLSAEFMYFPHGVDSVRISRFRSAFDPVIREDSEGFPLVTFGFAALFGKYCVSACSRAVFPHVFIGIHPNMKLHDFCGFGVCFPSDFVIES